jgi:hypothetical protein
MKACLVTMDGKSPVSRGAMHSGAFVWRHLPMLLICLMVATLIAVVLAPFMLCRFRAAMSACPVEAIRRRHCAQSTSAERRGYAFHFAIERIVFV